MVRVLCLLLVGGLTVPAGAVVTLERDVLPLLTKRCMGCHGGLKQKGGLDLRTLGAMLEGGDAGAAVVAGKPEHSELWLQVESGEMPKSEEKLTEDELAVLKEWISGGLSTVTDVEGGDGGTRVLVGDGVHAPAEVAAAIDVHVGRTLEAEGVTAAAAADDAAFLRRVSLDLTGRVPTAEQARAFLDDTDPDKRAKWVDTLLASDAFGEHFGRTWRDWVCPPELPSDMNSGKQPVQESRALGGWFAERFRKGEGWDRTVRDLLLAEGEIKQRPELIFYGLAGEQAKATADGSARSVASLFMGMQVGCAQCHDDPYKDLAQTEFWGLAAFFGSTRGDFKKLSEGDGEGQIKIPDSAFHNAGEVVPVAFPGGGGAPGAGKRKWRGAFVDWLVARDNPFFARAFANRLWFQFFARGIVDPVDDLRPLNPPSHPELLDLLEREFAASGFDVKHLVRCLCNSAAYQRTSAVAPGEDAAAVAREVALFGRMPLRVMTADMLLESLKLAYADDTLDLRTVAKDDGNTSGESAPVGDAYLQFQRDFCTNEEDATDFTHGVPQMLAFINHPRLLEGGKVLEGLAGGEEAPSAGEVAELLYLGTLSRRPTAEELGEAERHVGAAGAEAGYRDLLWMLVNRSEFICVR